MIAAHIATMIERLSRRVSGASRARVGATVAVISLALLLPIVAAGLLSTAPTADRVWFWQSPLPQGNDLASTSWVSNSVGWACGANGTLLKSVNGGSSWVALDSGTTTSLTGVSFINSNTGWVVGLSGLVKKTTDGGATWTSQVAPTLPAARNLRSVSFFDADNGIAVGDQGTATATIVYTSNGGTTWSRADTTATVGLTSVWMTTEDIGWAVGGNGTLLKTTNGGASWSIKASGTTAGLSAIAFSDDGTTGYFVGNVLAGTWTIRKTVNSGDSWTTVSGLGTTGAVNLFCVSVHGANDAAVIGANGQIRRTLNGGTIWLDQSQNSVSPLGLRGIAITDTNNAKVVGDQGLIFHTTSSGDMWFSTEKWTPAVLNATSFVDADHGYAVGANGTIISTTDAGRTWLVQAAGTTNWRDVNFFDRTHGAVVGDAGQILYTADGRNWDYATSSTTQQLNGVWFTSANIGIAVGNNGTILKTTNGGADWVVKPYGSGVVRSLNSVWFADPDTGYAVGANGMVRKTTDGGETWANTANAGSTTFRAVRGDSADVLWAVGDNGVISKTNDGGATNWTDQTSAGGFGTQPIRAASFETAQIGWITGTYGTVKKTTDGGTTWVAQNAGIPTLTTDPVVGLRGMSFVDAGIGYIVGDAGLIHRTIDGGSTWESLQYGTRASLNALSTPTDFDGWAVGTGGAVLHTANGGQSWSQQRTGSAGVFNAVDMADSARGWAVGDNGAIRYTANGGYNWSPQTSGTSVNLDAVATWNGVTAIAAGSGVVKRTGDSGANWTSASTLPTQPVTGLWMTNSAAYAVTTRVSGVNSVWRSADGGDTWTSVVTTANADLWAITFASETVGFAVGDSGVALKTTNGGDSWERKQTPTTAALYAVAFSDVSNGVASGGGGVVLRTSDGGETWSLSSSGAARTLLGIDYFAADRAWITGSSSTLLRMSDLVPPITTLVKDPPSANGSDGWYRTAPMLTLDSTTTPRTTYFSWSSSAGPYDETDATPFAAPEGVWTLYYYSVDDLGNAEVPKSELFKVDATRPTAPASASAASVATSSVQVLWPTATDAPSGVAYYNVYVNNALATSATAETVALTGLTPATINTITIETVDVAGNTSEARASVTFTTLGITPTTPLVTDISVTGTFGLNGWYVTGPSIVMTSYPLPGETATTHYSWVSATGPWVTFVPGGPALAPGPGTSTLYFYTTELSRFDEPVRSLTFKVDTSTVDVPSVTGASTSWDSIVATWAPVADTPSHIASYDVYLAGGGYDGSLYSSVTTTGIDIPGLRPATAYEVVVRARNFAGTYSSLSATVTVTTDLPPSPVPPAVVFAKAPAGNAAYVNWSAVTTWTGEVSYRVWRSDTEGGAYAPLGTTSDGVYGTTYIDDGLTSTTRYWYAVSVIDDRGEGATSDTSTAVWASTAPTTGPPVRPAGLTASTTGATISLQWLPSSDPLVRYYVLRAPDSLPLASAVTTLTPILTSATLYIDVTADAGEPYYYTVVAVDAAGTIGFPSLEAEGRAVIAPTAGQTMPHETGTPESGCMCHASHTAAGPSSLTKFPATGSAYICDKCHSPASHLNDFVDPLAISRHPLAATVSEADPFTCLTCHRPVFNAGEAPARLLLVDGSWVCTEVTGAPAGNGFCYKCHGENSALAQGDLTVFEGSGHSGIPAPSSGTGVVCDTCHHPHSSRNENLNTYSGFMLCMQCHTSSASNPNQPDIWSKLQLNEDANAKHPLLPADQVNGARLMCQNCHNTHTTSQTYPLVDPHDPSPLGTWTTPRANEKAFCFRCHDGATLPTSVETSSWAQAVLASGSADTVTDIQTTYDTNVHGFGTRSDPTTTTAYLRPDMGYTANTVLECRSCHDPHGTMNNYALQQNIVSASGNKTVSGVAVAKVPSGGYDLRFFCASCHVWDPVAHAALAAETTTTMDFSVFPLDCTQCHRHVDTMNFTGGDLL